MSRARDQRQRHELYGSNSNQQGNRELRERKEIMKEMGLNPHGVTIMGRWYVSWGGWSTGCGGSSRSWAGSWSRLSPAQSGGQLYSDSSRPWESMPSPPSSGCDFAGLIQMLQPLLPDGIYVNKTTTPSSQFEERSGPHAALRRSSTSSVHEPTNTRTMPH